MSVSNAKLENYKELMMTLTTTITLMMVTMKVTIHDVAPLALTLLVDFSYTGELVVSEDNVQVCQRFGSPSLGLGNYQ